MIYTSYFILTGFLERYDVCLINYSVSADGSEIKLETSLFSSMGFTRGYKDSGGFVIDIPGYEQPMEMIMIKAI